MRKILKVLFFTLIALVAIDVCVSVVLRQFQDRGIGGSLVRYFDYGRSVPGKLAQWQEQPDTTGNLFDVGWRENLINAEMTGPAAPTGVVRVYGMSFVNNILREAGKIDPNLAMDRHTGPGAPPNYTYAVFLDDADQRVPGDIAVLGILSSSVPALAAMSNRTWVFEQPTPMTYPIFRPDDDDGLVRIDPLVQSPDQERALREDAVARVAWNAQLRREDAFYGQATFGFPVLDASPFMRLVRRTFGINHIEERKSAVLDPTSRHAFPYEDVLQRMVWEFAQTARAEGIVPIVFLIQTRDLSDPNLAEVLGGVLTEHAIPVLDTADYVDPSIFTNFVSDGHYTRANDETFARAFLEFYYANTPTER
jgi:hypothetical protein